MGQKIYEKPTPEKPIEEAIKVRGFFRLQLENPDGTGQVGNVACGDIMKITISVIDGVISDIKFKTFGCAAAIATSSMIPEMV